MTFVFYQCSNQNNILPKIVPKNLKMFGWDVLRDSGRKTIFVFIRPVTG